MQTIRLILVLVFCLVSITANAELRIKATPIRFFNVGLNRYEALLYKRSIEANGWDWFVDNFIRHKTVMCLEIIQQDDRHSLLIHTRPQRNDQYFYSLKKVFDRMAELNDSVCLILYDNVDINKLKSDKAARLDFFNTYLDRNFWEYINDLASGYTVWVGDFFPCPGKGIFFNGVFTKAHFLSDKTKEEYERECAKRGYVPYPYRIDAPNWGTKEERDLYRQYLEKNYDKIIAESLPEQSVDIGITYDKPKKTMLKVLTREWINSLGLNKSLWP